MKLFFLLLSITASTFIYSQLTTGYVAARAGLSIRQTPGPSGTVIGKIPYGTKISFTYSEPTTSITTEGMSGDWVKVSYAGKTGYIVNSYLFPWPPPKASTKTMKDYLGQLSTVNGSPVTLKSSGLTEGGWTLKKSLYRNGAEWHDYNGYEYLSDVFFLPGFDLQEGFQLLRMIPEFNKIFTETEEFPTTSRTYKKGTIEYEVKVEKDQIGREVQKIRIDFAPDVIYFMEMYKIDNQLVIFTGSGV